MAVTHTLRRMTVSLIFAGLICSGACAEELSLSQAVDIALQNNPTISAGKLAAQAASDRARAAGSLVNPQVEVAPTVIGEAGADSAIIVSQPLEINGSRKVRGRIAGHEAHVVSYEAQAQARKLALEVRETYWDVAAAQATVQLYRENVEYLTEVHEATQKQLDVGAIPGSQLIKSEVELARARQEMSLAELELRQSRMRLNKLMNRPADHEFTATDPLTYQETDFETEALLDSALKTRPEVAAAQSELDAANSRIEAARIARRPDISIQVRRETFSSDSDQGVAIGISIPVFDWGSARAERKSAVSEAQAQQKRLEAAKAEVALEVRQAADEVETSAGIVREYQSGIIERSEELAGMARTGFERGAISYLEVLEAQRTLRNTRADYLTALANHSKALARLEWASGVDITTTSKEEKK